VLAGLLVILATVVGFQVLGGSAPRLVPAAAQAARGGRADAGGGAPPPQVKLEALGAEETEEPAPARNPFRFQPRTAARPAPANEGDMTPAPAVQRPAPVTARPAAAGARPIPLKFIGTVESAGAGLIAALSDGTFVFHGREGDVIDGRYRIVTIGVESIVLEHVDGGGRQTIRLTG